jgi:hypothetical protein
MDLQGQPMKEPGSPEPCDLARSDADLRAIRESAARDRVIEAAFMDLLERRAKGLAPDSCRSILDDPEIPEDVRFEVLLRYAFRMRPFPRPVPLGVLLARTPKGRQVMRKQGMRIPPPAERKAWEAWQDHRGPKPEDRRP